MEEETKMRVEASKYVKLLEELRQEAGDDEVAMAIIEQVGKDRRVRMMSSRIPSSIEPRTTIRDPDAEASSKQVDLLKRLGVAIPGKLTKGEASALIDQARAR